MFGEQTSVTTKSVEEITMKLTTPGTPQLMKQLNRATVIDVLTKQGPISQTRICEITGLSRATVSTIIRDLRQENLVLEVSKVESRAGRKRALLMLNSKAGYVIGVDLGGTKIAGALTDLSGDVVLEMKCDTNPQRGTDEGFSNLVKLINSLIDESGVPRTKLRGVGIGVPGVVNNGCVRWAPSLEWKDRPLATELQDHLDLPVFIENDVNLHALGEYWYGTGQGVENLVCLAIGTGLGAGIILNGQLYQGTHQAAGEVCNLVTDRTQLGSPYPGFGFLEQFASGTALARSFMGKTSFCPEDRHVDAELVFERARSGEQHALEVIDEFSHFLALSIVSISCVLDPELIILGGGVSGGADLFLERLKELCAPVLQVMPRIEVTRLGLKAGVMGAVALTLHSTSTPALLSRNK